MQPPAAERRERADLVRLVLYLTYALMDPVDTGRCLAHTSAGLRARTGTVTVIVFVGVASD
jgi:hypothetical protein